MRREFINTIPQLNSLIVNTYITAVIVGFIFVGLAYLVANLIPWQGGGGKDLSYRLRRIWFLILWVCSFASFFLYENMVVIEKIRNVAFQSKFRISVAISCGIIVVIYGVVSVLIMKFYRKSKFGSILGKLR
jgi:hypothetical protein